MDTVRTNTVIVGGGPAGLAVGACLQRQGLSAIILEQADQVGATWRRHYDRLHLHSDKAHSTLPFVDFPADVPRYPSRAQTVDYLQDYAERFELRMRFGQEVVSARPADGLWEARTRNTCYLAENLVIATGQARVPRVPSWPGQETFPGTVCHSSEYRNGRAFAGREVLVVGFGNSGGEIAIDLHEHGARPSIAVRSPVNVIPRELFGLPILTHAVLLSKLPARLADAVTTPVLRLLYGDLTELGLRRPPYGPLEQIERTGRIPLLDTGTIALIKEGAVRVCSGLDRFDGSVVHFSDGTHAAFDAVVLATGYRPQVDAFLKDAGLALDKGGAPVHSGREVRPGLYFCGFYVSPTGMLREAALEAKAIARSIARSIARKPG
jgi:cation diffusion facilitator CzcD-associated flavoprotein CzcO